MGKQQDRPFRYLDLGTMATVGRFRGLVYRGPLRMAGLMGWLAWLVVHLVFLVGFKNRVAALANWVGARIRRAWNHERPSSSA